MKLISWNIDSLNAALTGTSDRSEQTRVVLKTIAAQAPDTIAIQETKLGASGLTKKHQAGLAEFFPGYQYVWRSSEEPARKGYAGTLYLYKDEYTPTVTYPVIDAPSPMDQEGRIITLEFPDFFLTEVYTPNAGNGLKRLAEREVWDDRFREYLQSLDQEKPVLVSGDLNVAHEEIDLAHPGSNHHSAGFTDTFRHLNPDAKGQYTWWAQRSLTSKVNNSGWRIDYWLVSNRLADRVTNSTMLDSGERRDHTPIMLEIDLQAD